MSILLWHNEDVGFNRDKYPWVDKHLGMYGWSSLLVDLKGNMSHCDWAFPSLRVAIADPRVAGKNLIWLDPRGDIRLNHFAHPKTDAVYILGSDVHGFGDLNFDEQRGPHVRLPHGHEGEWPAVLLVPILCYDRFLFMGGMG